VITVPTLLLLVLLAVLIIAAVTHIMTDLLALVAVDGLAEVAIQVGQDQIETFRAELQSFSPAAGAHCTVLVVMDDCTRCC